MLIVNSEFKETSLNNVDKIIEFIKDNINNLSLDDQLKEKIMSRFESIIVQITEDSTYSIKIPDGSIRKNRMSNTTGANKTNMVIMNSADELHIAPGIVIRKNFTPHQFIHETLHALSSKQSNYYDDKGITYTKTGTKIDYYDQSLKDVINPDNLSSDGLNEGITEYLTSVFMNEFNGNYAPFTMMAFLFTKCNSMLLDAYFSDELDKMQSFYEDLEHRQNIITRDDLVTLNSKGFDERKFGKIIRAAIAYNESYGVKLSESELNFIVEYLDTYSVLDSGSWIDRIGEEPKHL